MRFGIFYEHQLPRPWEDGAELRLFQEALDQVELADRVGIDYAWEVEHHFLEEYSHSSAPEVFLAAASQRSKRIRLGHGIVLMPPAYNPPARVAERLATLDLVSGGRVDWGTGESASRAELEGFGIDPNERRAMWRETVEQVANMMVMDPYPGFSGKYFSMPVRNVLPRPVTGWPTTTRRSRGSACRSATPSTPTSRWSPASPVTPTRRKPGGAATMAFVSSSSRWPITTSSARTRRDARTSGTSIWPCAIRSGPMHPAPAPSTSVPI